MSIVAGRTRAQIRQAIGYLLPQKLFRIRASTGAGAGDGTTIADTGLPAGDDNQIGKWAVIAEGSTPAQGEIAQVTDSTGATSITVSPAFTAQVASGIDYEVWDEDFPPTRIHSLLDTAILSIRGAFYDPEESVAFRGDGYHTRFDIPTAFDEVEEILYRTGVEDLEIHTCDATWGETTDADFTQTVDQEDYKEGSGALKLTIAAGASAADKITVAISSKDISRYDTLEFWAKSTVTTTAGQIRLLLDDTAACPSPLETVQIPALTADEWTFCRVTLANPETDTAIISLGFEYTTDIGACVVWLDDIKVVRNNSQEWRTLPRHLWSVDDSARDLILSAAGREVISNRLMKLKGGGNPVLLTADSTVCEVPESWLIPYVAGLILASLAQKELARIQFLLAAEARTRFPFLENVRVIGG